MTSKWQIYSIMPPFYTLRGDGVLLVARTLDILKRRPAFSSSTTLIYRILKTTNHEKMATKGSYRISSLL